LLHKSQKGKEKGDRTRSPASSVVPLIHILPNPKPPPRPRFSPAPRRRTRLTPPKHAAASGLARSGDPRSSRTDLSPLVSPPLLPQIGASILLFDLRCSCLRHEQPYPESPSNSQPNCVHCCRFRPRPSKGGRACLPPLPLLSSPTASQAGIGGRRRRRGCGSDRSKPCLLPAIPFPRQQPLPRRSKRAATRPTISVDLTS
jgi:hypothetical protein